MHEFARVTSKGLSTVDIRTMRSFVAIVQTGSITHAAEELHVSQPALSRRIIELERELSCTLLDRKGRSATPTAEGRLLYSRAQELIDLVEKTEAEIKHPDLAQGEVRISCSETPATALIARVVKELTATHPGITVKFRSESSDDVTEHLSRGIADFGIVVGPARTDDFHIIGLPDIDTWGALLPGEHPLATRHHISPNDLLGEPLILPEKILAQQRLCDWMGTSIDKLDVRGTYNLLYTGTLLVRAGVGIALCLAGIADTSADSGLVFVPFAPSLTSRVEFIWSRTHRLSPAGAAFLECVQRHACGEERGR